MKVAYSLILLFLPALVLAQVPSKDDSQLDVIKYVEVEEMIGTGIAKLADETGVETPLQKGDFVTVGDTVLTDENVSVDLRMADGSLMRVTPSSSFTVFAIDQSNESEGTASWIFGLYKGLVESVVSKVENTVVGDKKEKPMKVRIKTPSATLGVRGTEFSIAQEGSEVFVETIDGEVLVGSPETNFRSSNDYSSVKKNQFVEFSTNEGVPYQASNVSAATAARNKRIAQRRQRARQLRAQRKLAKKQSWKKLSATKRSEIKKRASRSRNSIASMRKSGTIPVGSDVRKRLDWRRSAGTNVEIQRIKDRVKDLPKAPPQTSTPSPNNDARTGPNTTGMAPGGRTGGEGAPQSGMAPGGRAGGEGAPQSGMAPNSGAEAGGARAGMTPNAENGNRGGGNREAVAPRGGRSQGDDSGPGRNQGRTAIKDKPKARTNSRTVDRKRGDTSEASNSGGKTLRGRSSRSGSRSDLAPKKRKLSKADKAALKKKQLKKKYEQRKAALRSGKATVKSKSSKSKTVKSKSSSEKSYNRKRTVNFKRSGK